MAKLWSNVGVSVQSALATAITVTAVTKANPAVVTYTGTDPANGDYIIVTASGMWQIDGRVFRCANVNSGSNTLELEGVDSTAYDTFSSGSAQVITFGTTITSATDINVSGGDFEQVDITTIHDNQKKTIPGAASPVQVTMNAHWEPSDTGLAALKSASDSRAQRCFKFTFSDGAKWLFNGYVGCTMSPTGQAQQKVTTPITVTAAGKPTAYAT